jgi:hypothetical protein
MTGQGASLYELAPTYLRNRYRILFYTVLLTLVSVPILSALKFSGILIESFLAANLLAATMPVSGVRSAHTCCWVWLRSGWYVPSLHGSSIQPYRQRLSQFGP